jgi:hypothetical protein
MNDWLDKEAKEQDEVKEAKTSKVNLGQVAP